MYAVVHADQRPEIPADMPADYSALMQSCWTSDIGLRHGPCLLALDTHPRISTACARECVLGDDAGYTGPIDELLPV